MLEKFRKLLKYHQARVAHLLKRYKVKEPVSAEVVQKAFEIHGNKFLMDFIEIIKSTPGTYSHNGFISTYQPYDPTDDEPLVVGNNQGGAGGDGDKSNIWDFLGQIVNVGYDIYDSTLKKPYPYPGDQGYDPNKPYYSQKQPKSNTLTYVIIAVVAVLVLAFIFKK